MAPVVIEPQIEVNTFHEANHLITKVEGAWAINPWSRVGHRELVEQLSTQSMQGGLGAQFGPEIIERLGMLDDFSLYRKTGRPNIVKVVRHLRPLFPPLCVLVPPA